MSFVGKKIAKRKIDSIQQESKNINIQLLVIKSIVA